MTSPRFDSAKVLTIGDAMIDRYWHGDAKRISAEAPIPVVEVKEIEDRLGGAANVALNVSTLGAESLPCRRHWIGCCRKRAWALN